MEIVNVRFILTDQMLGTNPGNEQIFEDFILTKAEEHVKRHPEDAAEVLGGDDNLGFDVDAEVEKGTTVFRRNDAGELCIPGYMIKGNIKAIGDFFRANGNSRKAADENGKVSKTGWESFHKKATLGVHVRPKIISLGKKEPDGICVRPLRAMTMKGERTSLARSEYVDAGTSFECQIHLRGQITKKQLLEVLREGEFIGLGQWRGADKGTYSFKIL